MVQLQLSMFNSKKEKNIFGDFRGITERYLCADCTQ